MAHNQTRPKSPISWVGGKSKLTATIIPLIPPHHCYVEVFAGAAWVLFRKPPSKVEVINDINSDLTNMYKVIQHHHAAFIDAFEQVLVSRDQFDTFMATPTRILTDIQRAVRFYYMLRTSYAAKIVGQCFSVGAARGSRLNLTLLEQDIKDAHERLKRVWIENRSFAKLIPSLDKPNTFFYIDPPYWDCENVYGKGIFGKDDFAVLRDLLLQVKGKFIMSINDTPQIRELFADFHIKEVATQYSICRDSINDVVELLISNYVLPVADK
ncbi:Modification methylase DpnIIA [Ephemeroptericola cinctiostellae]|uniref:site-specific DNA-methyltransferase (adenine-specific) n=1 Tax=Ephemeroptericola cinctiostellae TaxID=2268024 RepID=A0A345DDE7_9BURK|nr:DNA adenine methylase [Ephemeroptericola cinctiostellae]AXF86385.1 Modification methylase DpnIIA [Ephemeroptericola cinctiostellae]